MIRYYIYVMTIDQVDTYANLAFENEKAIKKFCEDRGYSYYDLYGDSSIFFIIDNNGDKFAHVNLVQLLK